MATYTDNYALTKPTLSELADIRVINGNMDTIDDIMHGSQISFANPYDTMQTYNVGEYCMYDYKLYRCTIAVSIPEAFDPTKWERATTDEFETLYSDVLANEYDSTITYDVGSFCIYNNLLYRCITAVTVAEQFNSAKWVVTKVLAERACTPFKGATAQVAGEKGQVPAPAIADSEKFLKGDGTWATPSGGGGGGGLPDYSTTEQNTGRKWIDGSDIYVKTVTFSNTTITGSSYAHGISNMRKCIKHEIYMDVQSNVSWNQNVFVPYRIDDTHFIMLNRVTSTNLEFSGAVFFELTAIDTMYVTLYYTKTTV